MNNLRKQSLGDKIQIYRKINGYTQAQVAEMLNVQTATYCRYEKDIHKPKEKTLRQLAQIFGIPMTDFYSEDMLVLEKDTSKRAHLNPIQVQGASLKGILEAFNYSCSLETTHTGTTLTVQGNDGSFILDETHINSFQEDLSRTIRLLTLEKIHTENN